MPRYSPTDTEEGFGTNSLVPGGVLDDSRAFSTALRNYHIGMYRLYTLLLHEEEKSDGARPNGAMA